MIRRAKVEDANDIVKIVDSLLLKNLSDTKNGFLTSNRGVDHYKKFIKNSKYCYVAIENKRVVGYLIAHPNSFFKSYKEDYINTYIIQNCKGKFVHVCYIAVLLEFQRMNIGKRLYLRLFKETKGLKLTCATSANPYNPASEKMHLKLGFKKIGKVNGKSGASSFIYERT